MKNTFKKLLLTSSIIVLMHSTYSFANNIADYSKINNLINEKKYMEAVDAYKLATKNMWQNEYKQQKFLDLRNKTSEGFLNQGKDAKSSEEALKMFDLAIQINPHYCKAYMAKISAYHRLSDYKNVLKTFEDASFCNSCKTTDIDDYIRVTLFMGEVLYTIEKYKDAIEVYNLALKVKPNDNKIKGTKYIAENYKKVNTLINQQEYMDAEKAYQSAIKDTPKQWAQNKLLILLQNKISEGAFKQAIEFFQNNVSTGKLEQAIPMFDLAIKLNPNNCEAYMIKAVIYKGLADYDNVLKSVKDASSCDSCKTTDIDYYISTALSIAKGLSDTKRYSDAIKVYNIALKVKPNDNDIKEAKNKAEKAKNSK